MVLRLSLISAVAFLFGCSHIATVQEDGVTSAEILDYSIHTMNRLDRIAAPLLKDNFLLCPKIRRDNGIQTHRSSDYPEPLRAAAQTEWGLDEHDRVRFIIRGSPAHSLSVSTGDRIIEDSRTVRWWGQDGEEKTRTVTPDIICDYGLKIIFSEHVNGHSDLDTIFVTSGLLDTVPDDVNLALIVAHELGHVIEGHRPEEGGKEIELLADRMALILMARAEYDIDRAIGYWERSELTEAAIHDDSATHPSVIERVTNFQTARDAIRDAQTDGRELDFTLIDQ